MAEERRGEEQTVARARDARRPGRAPGDVLWGRRWPGHTPLLLPVALLLGALAVRLPLLGLTAGYDLRVVAGMARRAAGGQDVYALGVQRLDPWAYCRFPREVRRRHTSARALFRATCALVPCDLRRSCNKYHAWCADPHNPHTRDDGHAIVVFMIVVFMNAMRDAGRY